MACATGITINYERKLTPSFNVRLGGGFSSDDFHSEGQQSALLLVPSFVLGKRRHQFTGGIGVMVLFDEPDCAPYCHPSGDWNLASEVSYRYQAKFGLLFRASVGFVSLEGIPFFPVPGVSLGWSF